MSSSSLLFSSFSSAFSFSFKKNAGFIGFYRVLWLWKGSLYKGIWKSLVVYCSFYAAISVFYRCVLCLAGSEYWKETFEKFCVFFGKYYHVLPLNFILGFYVTQVISQWWKQYSNLVWTDSLAMDLVSFLPGSGFLKKLKDVRFPLLPGSGRPKQLRRQIIRRANLANVLCLRMLR